jgi:hypothetical protein
VSCESESMVVKLYAVNMAELTREVRIEFRLGSLL